MIDQRIKKMARVLLQYCIKLKKKQLVKLIGGEQAIPLLKELYGEALAMGAYPYTKVYIEGLEELLLKKGSRDQLAYVSPLANHEVEKIDAVVGVDSPLNTKHLSGTDPHKQALMTKAQSRLLRRLLARAAKKQLAWVGTLFPTHASAQDAGMSLSDYEDFVYRACHIDKKDPIAEWKKISRYNRRLINYLKKRDIIRITAPDTDLTFKIAGRTWINCDGENNFPDGEVFTAPLENSANGHIRFSFPAVYRGHEVDDVKIEFKNGKVVKATAGRGQKFLETMLNIDRGARYIGEVAIGTNYGIKISTRNTLFDEKIGGTFHLALGKAYPESGGKNKSALHWDMICDLRKGGCIYADGQLFFKNGKFLK